MFNLKAMRTSSGLTQTEVADRIGISVVTYRSWESGRYMLNLEQAVSLADLFVCTLDALAGRDFSPARPEDPERDRLDAAWGACGGAGRALIADTAQAVARRGI